MSLLDQRVVEVASYVAGPSATMTLAQLGADVIRVDPPGGASDRKRWPLAPSGVSLYWAALNRGKRSVVIDVRRPEGRELVLALAAAGGPRGGVVVDNLARADWLSRDAVADVRADLVHLRVLGRPDGRPSLDYTANAAVGVPLMTGPVDGTPVNHVLPAWDLLTGQYVVVALLAALAHRERTGAGAELSVSLDEVALAGVSTLGWAAAADLTGHDRGRYANQVYGSFGADFETADHRRVMVVALGRRPWDNLCLATGTTAVFEAVGAALGHDLGTDAGRFAAREVITAVLRPWFADRDLVEAAQALDAAGALWGPYRSMTEAVELGLAPGPGPGLDPVLDPVLAAGSVPGDVSSEPLLHRVDQEGVGPMVGARFPVRGLDQLPDGRPAPVLGAHTSEVLTEVLGLGDLEIGRLLDDGVVEQASATADA